MRHNLPIAMATPIPQNHCRFTLAEVARATGGRLFGDGNATVRGVSIDTRTIEPGALFVALKGANSDGHQYLSAARRRGAAAAIAGRGRHPPALAAVEVDDPLAALGQLARHHLGRIRRARSLPSAAIGGAAGKTTTKEIAAAAVGALFGPALSTPGNLNNLIGVPMTLLTLTDRHRAMVIECGTNTRGEIRRLSGIVEPDVAMVLNVDLEHTEGLGTLEDVADEEASLFAHARRTAVIPAGDAMLARRVPGHLRTVTFGRSEHADVRLVSRELSSDGKARLVIRLGPPLLAEGVDGDLRAEVAMLGPAAALNCAAAIAAAAAAAAAPLGTDQLRALEAVLARVEPVLGRLLMKPIRGIVVIDDTYNANPRSMRAALMAAREVADGRGARLLVALGDMLELGGLSKSAHARTVQEVLEARPAVFVAVGGEMAEALAAASAGPGGTPTEARVCADPGAAAGTILGLARAGDVLLVKGSRGLRMERIIEALEARPDD